MVSYKLARLAPLAPLLILASSLFGQGPTFATRTTTAPTQAAGNNSTKIANTAFVTTAINNAIAGVNPAVAVQTATTTVLPAVTYTNGVAGVGALLTQNSAAILVIDGYTPILGDRLLIKNQASAFQNGVYNITTLGTGIIPFILTRVLDYDQPSDINNTGAIPVVNGTVNALTSWLLTSTVVNVGTDALTYTQFSYSAANAPHVINFVIDGGGVVIAIGDTKVYPSVNYSCTINKVMITADQSGSITVDIWKANAAIPTSGNKISASAPVTLSTAQINQNSSIAGWTTSVSTNDVFGFSVATATTVTRVVGEIWCL